MNSKMTFTLNCIKDQYGKKHPQITWRSMLYLRALQPTCPCQHIQTRDLETRSSPFQKRRESNAKSIFQRKKHICVQRHCWVTRHHRLHSFEVLSHFASWASSGLPIKTLHSTFHFSLERLQLTIIYRHMYLFCVCPSTRVQVPWERELCPPVCSPMTPQCPAQYLAWMRAWMTSL